MTTQIECVTQAMWWASRQGLEGCHDRVTRETCCDGLRRIAAAKVTTRITQSAFDGLCAIGRRAGERRGAA